MSKPKAHVANWKKEEVKKLETLISKYKIIGIADLTSVASAPLQKMKLKLKPGTVVYIARKNLLDLAFKNLAQEYPHLENLCAKMSGMVTLVLTNDNPFKLAAILNKSKSPAPAKAGQIAPNDIKIPTGPTSFAPGPIIGELGKIGIKTSVEGGKVAVKVDTVVTKKGEEVSKDVATVLARLEIHPMEIGINLIAAYENGTIFDAMVLNVNEKEFKRKLGTAILDAYKLAYSVKYVTKENIEAFIKEAYLKAKALAEGQKIEVNISDHTPHSVPEEKKNDTEVAQDVLKKLQDEKIAKGKF